jgi:hypothetical protein
MSFCLWTFCPWASSLQTYVVYGHLVQLLSGELAGFKFKHELLVHLRAGLLGGKCDKFYFTFEFKIQM